MADSALVILVPEAEPLVAPIREEYDPSAAKGMPAHITVLYPFKTPETIDDGVRATLSDYFRSFQAFQFSLTGTLKFPTALCLSPEPVDPFVKLTEGLEKIYPECPPYGASFSGIVPHLTVVWTEDEERLQELTAKFERVLAGAVPIDGSVSEVWLIVEHGDQWVPVCPFRLDDSE